MLPAHVEEQNEIERLLLGGEVDQRLFLALVENAEIAAREAGEDAAVSRGHFDVHMHEGHVRAKDRVILCGRAGSGDEQSNDRSHLKP